MPRSFLIREDSTVVFLSRAGRLHEDRLGANLLRVVLLPDQGLTLLYVHFNDLRIGGLEEFAHSVEGVLLVEDAGAVDEAVQPHVLLLVVEAGEFEGCNHSSP